MDGVFKAGRVGLGDVEGMMVSDVTFTRDRDAK